MTVPNLGKNIHEIEIFSAIKKSMPNGIHVQGLIRDFKLSTPTVLKYLDILENEKKLVYHEKIKNKYVYKINLHNFPTFSEIQKSYNDELKKLKITIINAINHSSKWGLSERLEVYNHVSTVIALTRYYHQMEIDALYNKKDSVPEELLSIVKEIDSISEIISKTINPLMFEFHRTQIDNVVFNSMEFLETVPKQKKGKQSKFMKKIFEEMKLQPEVYNKVKEIEKVMKKSSIKK